MLTRTQCYLTPIETVLWWDSVKIFPVNKQLLFDLGFLERRKIILPIRRHALLMISIHKTYTTELNLMLVQIFLILKEAWASLLSRWIWCVTACTG